MKNFCLVLILSLALYSCKKEIPMPDVIKLKVFSTKIKHHNYNEPDILYWYVRTATKGGYFYMTSTKDIKDFTDYSFTYTVELPNDIANQGEIKQIVVWINQLNGDMFYDITGENAQNIEQ